MDCHAKYLRRDVTVLRVPEGNTLMENRPNGKRTIPFDSVAAGFSLRISGRCLKSVATMPGCPDPHHSWAVQDNVPVAGSQDPDTDEIKAWCY